MALAGIGGLVTGVHAILVARWVDREGPSPAPIARPGLAPLAPMPAFAMPGAISA